LAIDPRQRHLPTPVRAFVDFMRRNARDLACVDSVAAKVGGLESTSNMPMAWREARHSPTSIRITPEPNYRHEAQINRYRNHLESLKTARTNSDSAA